MFLTQKIEKLVGRVLRTRRSSVNRRQRTFHGSGAPGGRALPIAAMTFLLSTNLQSAPPIPQEYKIGRFVVGCQAYTFNRFSVFEAIEKTAQAGGRIIELYPGQKLSPEQPDIKWD